jgi:hypothetical protein
MAGSGSRGKRGLYRNGRGSGPTPVPKPLSKSAPQKAGVPTPPPPAAQQSAKGAMAEGPPPEAIARLETMEQRLSELACSIPGYNQDTDEDTNDDENVGFKPITKRIVKLEKLFNKLISVMESLNERDEMRERQRDSEEEARASTSEATITSNKASIPTTNKNKKRRTYAPFDHHSNPLQSYTRFFSITFETGIKRKVNPYAVKNQIITTTGKPPVKISSNGRDSLTILVEDALQGNKMADICTIGNIPCKTEKHQYLNNSKGIIYIQEYDVDDIDEFRNGLMENYNITRAEPAPFIKPKSAQTKAFILTFDQETPPKYLYIPGERYDTVVYPYHERPKLCQNCQHYGHTKNRCAKPIRCRKCSEEGHIMAECTSEPSCFHCDGVHQIGYKDCPKQLKENKITELQEKHKVGIRRARQMYAGEATTPQIEDKKQFTTHYHCKLDENNKRKITPWVLEKSINQATGEKPKTIRSLDKTAYVIEVNDERQGHEVTKMTHINNFPVKMTEHDVTRFTRGLVYVYECDLLDFETFKTGLIDEFGIQDAEMAFWIKPRNMFSKPVMITFKTRVPDFLDIPGEQSKTKVYEYLPSPMLCKKCLTYGHTAKRCDAVIDTCAKCDEEGHSFKNCTSTTEKCHHCKRQHRTAWRTCPIHIYEKELIAIQTRLRIGRSLAIREINNINPNIKMNFAAAVEEGRRADEGVVEEDSTPNAPIADTDLSEPGTSGAMALAPGSKRHRDTEDDKLQNLQGKKKCEAVSRLTPVVCMSPNTNRIYTVTVNLEPGIMESDKIETCTSDIKDQKDKGNVDVERRVEEYSETETSETSLTVRKEAKVIFNDFMPPTDSANTGTKPKSHFTSRSSSFRRRSTSHRTYRDNRESSLRDRSRSPKISQNRSRSRSRQSRRDKTK